MTNVWRNFKSTIDIYTPCTYVHAAAGSALRLYYNIITRTRPCPPPPERGNFFLFSCARAVVINCFKVVYVSLYCFPVRAAGLLRRRRCAHHCNGVGKKKKKKLTFHEMTGVRKGKIVDKKKTTVLANYFQKCFRRFFLRWRFDHRLGKYTRE